MPLCLSRLIITHTFFLQVQALYVRTGVEVLVVAARSSQEQWLPPYVMSTSERVTNFFDTCFNQDVETFATRLEAYCLSGIGGMLSALFPNVWSADILDRSSQQSLGRGHGAEEPMQINGSCATQ